MHIAETVRQNLLVYGEYKCLSLILIEAIKFNNWKYLDWVKNRTGLVVGCGEIVSKFWQVGIRRIM